MPAERRSAAICGVRAVSVRPVPARCCSGCGLFLFRLVPARCCYGCGLFLFGPFPLGVVPAADCFCSSRSRSVPFRLRAVSVSARSRSVLFRLRGIFVRAAACSAACVPFGCPESLERRPIKYIFLIFSVVSPTLLSPCSAVRNPDAAACTRPRNMPFRCREQQYRRHDHIRLPGRSSHRVRRCSRFGDTVASSCLRSYPPLLRRSSYKRGRSRPRENNSFIIG